MKALWYAGMVMLLAFSLVSVRAQTAMEAIIETPDITVADLKTAIAEKKVTLVDCNGTESYAKGHLPGALDFTAAGENLAKLLPEDKAMLVVAYCGGPKCKAYKAGVAAVKKLGYTNIKYFSGGLSGWQEAGEALEK